MALFTTSLWTSSLWKGGLWKGSIWGAEGIDYSLYYFYFDPGINLKDQVSLVTMETILSAGRIDEDGNIFAINTPVVDSAGWLNSYGVFEHLDLYSEDTSNWTGSGPWTQVINLTSTGTYTISTDLNGATLTITAGTATIDSGASATYGNDDQFIVTGAGTVTLTTDTVDPKSQLTETSSRFPYIKTLGSTVTVPSNNSNAANTEYNAWPIEGQLLDALDGVAGGVELIGNPDLESDDTGWVAIQGDEIGFNARNTTNPISGVADYKISVTTSGTGTVNPYIRIDYVSANQQLLGKRWELSFAYKVNSGTCILKRVRNGFTGTNTDTDELLSGEGTYHLRQTSDDADDNTQDYYTLYFNGTNEFEIQIDNVSVQVLDDAKGRLRIQWTPQFNAGDIGADLNIFTGDNGSKTKLYYDDVNNLLKMTDGTNTATVACTPVSGTAYEIVLNYGDNSGPKMQLSLDAVDGSAVTFAGRFPVAERMKYAYDSDAWQKTKITSIKIEPEFP